MSLYWQNTLHIYKFKWVIVTLKRHITSSQVLWSKQASLLKPHIFGLSEYKIAGFLNLITWDFLNKQHHSILWRIFELFHTFVHCCFLSWKYTIVFKIFQKVFFHLAFMDHNVIHTIFQNNLPSTNVNSFGQFIIVQMLLKQLPYWCMYKKTFHL